MQLPQVTWGCGSTGWLRGTFARPSSVPDPGGGLEPRAVLHAADEAQVLLQGLGFKEYTERSGINTLSSANILNFLNENAAVAKEKFGVELMSLAIQSLDPTDPEIADALRQQEQARLLEQTERLQERKRRGSPRPRPKHRRTRKSRKWNTRWISKRPG